MTCFQALVVEPVFLQAADLEVLDDDIRMGSELAHELLPLGRLEIGRDGALAAVAGMEIGGREIAAVCCLDEGRSPAAGVVARARPLDLHHIGAEIGQQLADPGTGENAREFEDFQAFERFHRAQSITASRPRFNPMKDRTRRAASSVPAT